MNRAYYLFQLVLTSPMSVGSGESRYTDHDIVLDSRGLPFIPATAIAGVFRHYLGEDCRELFGCINGDKGEPSHVIFYDACETRHTFTTIRDCVRMNDGEKTAKNGAKFDLQAEETNAVFEAVIELDEIGCKFAESIESAIAALNSGILRFGTKTSRGYGAVKVNELYKAEFTLPDDADRWLDFDMFSCGDSCYNKTAPAEYSGLKYTRILLNLSQNGGISIREYSTERQENSDKMGANFKQMSLNSGVPVIPGTSWAGAFRSRYTDFCGAVKCRELFGYVDEVSSDGRASRISFSESQIQKNTYIEKLITRNAVDRFSGGVKDSALFSERAVFNGKSSLEITIKKATDEELSAVCAVICDLDRGYLAVGGLTSVGRGLFSVDSIFINGADVTQALKEGDIAAMVRRNAHDR